MEYDDNLDSPYSPVISKVDFYTSVKWWEQKRFLYNLILIGTQILVAAVIASQQSINDLVYFIDAVVFTIAANCFFSIAWIFELLYMFYFNSSPFLIKTRMIYFISGILFSIALTAVFFFSVV